jgi:hypothetical protein
MSTTTPLSTWQTNATFWDQIMGPSGNDYYKDLELPSLKRMAAITGDERALDLATGNGLVARWMVGEGVKEVVATDGSENMLELAEKRWAEEVEAKGKGTGDGEDGKRLSFQLLDVTDEVKMEEFVKREGESVRGFCYFSRFL